MLHRTRHHYDPVARLLGGSALLVSLLGTVFAMTGMGEAQTSAPPAPAAAQIAKANTKAKHKPLPGPSTTPRRFGLLRLNALKRFPSAAIPTVAKAKDATTLGGATRADLGLRCPQGAVDLGSWCLDETTQGLPLAATGKNDFAYAARTCVAAGGYLPSAAQLIGAASRVRLSSTIDDEETTALIDIDPTVGLKDHREMSGTLFTVSTGGSAAGSEGVTVGSKGDPRAGEPDPVPAPADPIPSTLDYVTVYDNHDQGGFAGGAPVGQPERFRCAYDKSQPASKPAADDEDVQ
jgi:hypothetical protein